MKFKRIKPGQTPKRKKGNRKKIKAVCQYCKEFWDGEAHKLGARYTRLCPIKDSHVYDIDPACKRFSLHKYIWCSKHDNMLPTKTCVNRQNNRMDGCITCKQGKIIAALFYS